MSQIRIPTFIINLEKRVDRKEHILAEFSSRNEFKVSLIRPIFDEIGAVSLWKTMIHILANLSDDSDEYVLICEDDHKFTPHYSKELLENCIQLAAEHDVDVLSGGVHWFNSCLPVSRNIFWVDRFTGTQFIIIFRRFFKTMINADFGAKDAADRILSDLTSNILLIGPFVSVQKDFGYSDATPKNNIDGEMRKLFGKSMASIDVIERINSVYKKRTVVHHFNPPIEGISIPVYIIKLNEEDYISVEFSGREEFDPIYIERMKNEYGQLDMWFTVKEIVRMGLENDDDVIIICDSEHKFTEHYNKRVFIQNLIEAYSQGCEILVGSIYSFGLAVPISLERAWINNFVGAEFIILYRPVFQKILNEGLSKGRKVSDALSDITSNKMVFSPFLSRMRTPSMTELAKRDTDGEIIVSLLEEADSKLEKMYNAYNRYKHLS